MTSWPSRILSAIGGFSPKSHVVTPAHSVSNVRPMAVFTSVVFFMKSAMLSLRLKKHKVLKSVVTRNTVNVVDYFRSCQKPSKVCFHYKPVLFDISRPIFLRMVWGKNLNISSPINTPSTLIISSFFWVLSKKFVAAFFTHLCSVFRYSVSSYVNRFLASGTVSIRFVFHAMKTITEGSY